MGRMVEGEHVIVKGAKLENKTCGYVRKNYKIKIIHVHQGLSKSPERKNPPDNLELKNGMYVHFKAPFDEALKFLKDSCSS